MRILFVTLLVAFTQLAVAQNVCNFIIRDSLTNESLPGVSVKLKNSSIGGVSDDQGNISLTEIPDDDQEFIFTYVGYEEFETSISFPTANHQTIQIFLVQSIEELGEIIVSSTRTNARIEDQPTKIEVLGLEEMDEESLLVPGSIASLLGDISVITIQKTDQLTGDDAVRMQGLDGRYTQILRDGLPLFDGFSGNIGVLDIQPLDLQQVEIIKGSNSTLYGGGAIAGLINFISRTPEDSMHVATVLNLTSEKGFNFSSFVSNRNDKIGFTLFTAFNKSTAYSYNSRGYSVVPDEEEAIIHPRLFFYLSDRAEMNVGVNLTFDELHAGDMDVINGYDYDHLYEYYSTKRQTYDLHYRFEPHANNELTVKAAGSIFKQVKWQSYDIGEDNYYAEVADKISIGKHTLVAGADFNLNRFHAKRGIKLRLEPQLTAGIFLQDDWQVLPKLIVEPGIRIDQHSLDSVQLFVLPHLALFYKPAKNLSIRFAFGTGYNLPDPLELVEPNHTIDTTPASTVHESSTGYNADINYHVLTANHIRIEMNEAIYYTKILNTFVIDTSDALWDYLVNDATPIESYGIDTYIRIGVWNYEFYIGYNHTIAHQQTDSVDWFVPFNPQDKISTSLTGNFWEHLNAGIEASYFSNQYISDNKLVDNYIFVAAMISYQLNHFQFALNCENLTNFVIQNHGEIVLKPYDDPTFLPIWGPIEGRVINLSCKIDF